MLRGISLKTKKQPWNIGDVYAYKINSDIAKEFGLIGRYFLLQKIDEIPYSSRIMAPIVYVKITKDEKMPTTTEEFDQLEFVQIKSSNYEERFYPFDFSRLQEDIEQKSSLTYTVDEYGYLPQFRVLLVLAAGKCVPPDLVYVGSFPDAAHPKIEFIPHTEFNLRMIFCKKNSTLLDRILSIAYQGHNLRTLKRYQNNNAFQSQNVSDTRLETSEKGLNCMPEWMRTAYNKGNTD